MMTASIWQFSTPVRHVEPPPKPDLTKREVIDTPDLDRLRSALAAIPNSDTNELDYDHWRNVVFAIHEATEGQDHGLMLAHEFSSRSGKYDADFLEERVWPYIGRTSGDLVPADYIFKMAERHGWQDPATIDDFDVVDAPADDFEALPAAEAKPEALRFRPVPAHEFAVATQLRWIIKGVLPHAELAVVYGESGSGKSFAVLDIGAAIARGIEWRGHKVHQGKVVYVAAEGANGFRNRLRAYAHQHQIDLKDLPLHVIHAAPNLLEKADAVEVAKSILHVVGKPDLIIIDTLAQTIPGGNENGGEDMGKALAHCRGIHRATGALVLLVHHSGKDSSKGARGWSGLRAAADVEMEVMRADDDRVLTVTKQKDGDDGAEFGFKLETVLVDFDADGDEVTSCVVSHCDAANVKAKTKRCAIGTSILRVADDLAGLDGCLPTVHEVIAETVARMAPPEEGKSDSRRKRVMSAFDTLVAAGGLSVEAGRVRAA